MLTKGSQPPCDTPHRKPCKARGSAINAVHAPNPHAPLSSTTFVVSPMIREH